MKRIKMIVASMVAGAAALLTVAGSQPAMAVTCPTGTPGAGKGVSSLAECSLSEDEDTLTDTFLTIIRVALGVLGLVAVAFIIVGGFNYITSNGDAAKLAKAKNTILYAVIGLVVALLAFAIVNFVLDNVFNDDDSTSTTQTDDGSNSDSSNSSNSSSNNSNNSSSNSSNNNSSSSSSSRN